MLSDNIKTARKNKGLTQEELANKLNVVRQTVSKWEKGFSVPDADTLQRIADILEVDIKHLLGAPVKGEDQPDAVAEQLSRINEYLAVRSRRSRLIWRVVLVLFAIIFLLMIFSFSA